MSWELTITREVANEFIEAKFNIIDNDFEYDRHKSFKWIDIPHSKIKSEFSQYEFIGILYLKERVTEPPTPFELTFSDLESVDPSASKNGIILIYDEVAKEVKDTKETNGQVTNEIGGEFK